MDSRFIDLASSGQHGALAAALAMDPELATARNPGDETLLHIVARQWPKLANGAAIARTLLAAGADVNAADQDGLRPIQGATGDLELTRVLVDAGADLAIYATNHMNMSPAETCLFYRLPEEARLLVKAGAPVDLRVAAGIGALDRVQSYLDSDGAFRENAIGLPDQPGPTLSLEEGVTQALSYAARNGQVEVVLFLLDHGADINARVPYFDVACTPLHQAVSGDQPAVLETLLGRGARQDVCDDSHDSTPRDWAVHQGKAALVAMFDRYA